MAEELKTDVPYFLFFKHDTVVYSPYIPHISTREKAIVLRLLDISIAMEYKINLPFVLDKIV